MLYILCFVLLLFPLIIFDGLYNFAILPKVLFLVFCSLIIVLYDFYFIYSRKSLEINKEKLIYVFLCVLFILSLFITLFFSNDKVTVFVGSIDKYLGIGTIVFIIFITFHISFLDERGRKIVLKSIIISGFLVAFIGLLQIFGIFGTDTLIMKTLYDGRIGSTIGNYNNLGIFLLIPMYLCLLFGTNSEEKGYRILRIFMFIIILTGIFLTGSRGVLLIGILGIIIYLIRFNQTKYKILFLGLSLFISAILIFLNNRFHINQQNLGSIYSRIELFKYGINSFESQHFLNKLFGNGSESVEKLLLIQYNSNILKYEQIGAIPESTHNIILDMILEYGIFGIILFSSLIFYPFFIFLKLSNKKGDTYIFGTILISLVFCLLGSVNSITSFFYLFLFLSLIISLIKYNENNYKINNSFLYFPLIIILIIIFISIKLLINDLKLNIAYVDIIHPINKEIRDKGIVQIKNGYRDKFKSMLVCKLFSEGNEISILKLLLDENIQDQMFITTKIFFLLTSSQDLNQVEIEVNKLLSIFPNNIYGLGLKGDLYFNRQNYKNALAVYEKLFKGLPDFMYKDAENISIYEKIKFRKIVDFSPELINQSKRYILIYKYIYKLIPLDMIKKFENLRTNSIFKKQSILFYNNR